MMRSVCLARSVRPAALAALLALAAPGARAQLARPRTASPDAPKLLVLPFQRDRRDSALALLVADGARERLRTNWLDRFNPISRENLCQNLTQSGFPCDVPLDPPIVRQLVRWINARYVIEGTLLPASHDSVTVVARLSEAAGADPQAATEALTVARAQLGTRTGQELVNRLMDDYDAFEKVTECRRKLDAQDLQGARRAAQDALRQFPNSAGAYLCIARILEAQNAPPDSILAALLSAHRRDTLNTLIMRRIAQRYQQAGDTANLLLTLKQILRIDFRDIDLRINTVRMMAQMGQADSALIIANNGLRENPANADLLGAKAIAAAADAAQLRAAADSLPAGPAKDSALARVSALWDTAGVTLATVADVDSTKVDSLFLVRITNYFRQVPDTARWVHWTQAATTRLPGQLDNWYTLASVYLVRGDSAGALGAARSLLAHLPPHADTAQSGVTRAYYARASYIVATILVGKGAADSAAAAIADAVRADSTIRPQAAVVYLQAGLKSYRDSAYTTAVERLQKAKDYSAPGSRAFVTSAFFLGLSQVQAGVQMDHAVETSRSCDDARKIVDWWPAAEQNVIAGAAYNRDNANQLLQAIAAYKQRADAFVHNFCR